MAQMVSIFMSIWAQQQQREPTQFSQPEQGPYLGEQNHDAMPQSIETGLRDNMEPRPFISQSSDAPGQLPPDASFDPATGAVLPHLLSDLLRLDPVMATAFHAANAAVSAALKSVSNRQSDFVPVTCSISAVGTITSTIPSTFAGTAGFQDFITPSNFSTYQLASPPSAGSALKAPFAFSSSPDICVHLPPPVASQVATSRLHSSVNEPLEDQLSWQASNRTNQLMCTSDAAIISKSPLPASPLLPGKIILAPPPCSQFWPPSFPVTPSSPSVARDLSIEPSGIAHAAAFQLSQPVRSPTSWSGPRGLTTWSGSLNTPRVSTSSLAQTCLNSLQPNLPGISEARVCFTFFLSISRF
ncbi:unnamed protein product [Protopolystoma xenopodis]|uniref:Uncharacterized protein n=1 Tax=Protopolystoma xenopodis TaxID=117903 RepID=A0A448XHW0_9PLAT|nr:unnamed protein product [Protopolystoma xenopodis]